MSEVVEDVLAGLGVAAPIGIDGGELELFAEEVLAEAREEHEEGGGFEHAGAEGVGNGDVAGVDGLNESGDAEGGVAAEFEGVAEVIILAAEDDVDLLEAAERFQENVVVADGEVGAFHECEAQVAGEVGVFEIGFVERPGGEEDDAGGFVVVRGEGCEGVADGAEERGEALHAAVAENVGHGAGDDEAVFQCVAGAGGGLRAISDDAEAAVGGAADVGGIEVQPSAVGNVHAMKRAEVTAVAEDELGRDEAVAEKLLRAVEIGKKVIEKAGRAG